MFAKRALLTGRSREIRRAAGRRATNKFLVTLLSQLGEGASMGMPPFLSPLHACCYSAEPFTTNATFMAFPPSIARLP